MQAELYGHLEDGTAVHRLALQAPGLRLAVLTYGGIVASLEVPDRGGRMGNVVLGLPTLADYVRRSPYFGAIVGRYANRIARGRLILDGAEYQLACNNGPNALHGGVRGFDKRVWSIVDASIQRVELAYASADGEEGYPGALQGRVAYELRAADGCWTYQPTSPACSSTVATSWTARWLGQAAKPTAKATRWCWKPSIPGQPQPAALPIHGAPPRAAIPVGDQLAVQH